MSQYNIEKSKENKSKCIGTVQAQGTAKYLVKFVQKKNMTLEQAAEMLEASDEAMHLARQQLQK